MPQRLLHSSRFNLANSLSRSRSFDLTLKCAAVCPSFGCASAGETSSILVISHDDRYYHLADHIIKLEYGKIDYDQNVAELEVKARQAVPVNR